jgi:hypothetical protein
MLVNVAFIDRQVEVIIMANPFSSGHITYFDFGRGENLKYSASIYPPLKRKPPLKSP